MALPRIKFTWPVKFDKTPNPTAGNRKLISAVSFKKFDQIGAALALGTDEATRDQALVDFASSFLYDTRDVYKIVQLFLDAGVTQDARSKALGHFIRHNDYCSVELLVAAGVDIGARNDGLWQIKSTDKMHERIPLALLSAGVDEAYRNGTVSSIVGSYSLKLLKAVLEAGASLESRKDAMNTAVRVGNAEKLSILFSSVEVELQDSEPAKRDAELSSAFYRAVTGYREDQLPVGVAAFFAKKGQMPQCFYAAAEGQALGDAESVASTLGAVQTARKPAPGPG